MSWNDEANAVRLEVSATGSSVDVFIEREAPMAVLDPDRPSPEITLMVQLSAVLRRLGGARQSMPYLAAAAGSAAQLFDALTDAARHHSPLTDDAAAAALRSGGRG